VNVVITVAGLAGLAVAVYFLAELVVDAVRRRQFLDIGIAAGVVVLTVWLLLTYGDALLQ
jgi:threonine/homoserine efflux transporter RhtA